MLQTRIFNPAAQGYRILFHEGQANPCPGCGRSQWYVGRSSAECAFCGVALPLAEGISYRGGIPLELDTSESGIA
jgi:hypothetical protein